MTDNVDVEEQEEGQDAADGDAPAGDTPAAPDTETSGTAESSGAPESSGTPEAVEEQPAPAALEAGPAPVDPVRDRLVLPILLPLLSMVAVFLYVVNVSRVFLAGGNEVSVLVGTILTVGILVGGAAISASPSLRSSTLVLGLSGFMVLVLSAGLLSLGPSEGEEEAGTEGYQQPSGPAVATLEVQALPQNTFQATEFQVPAGIVEVNYVQVGGSHTLLFTDPKFNGFQLAVPRGPKTGKVEVEPGSYTIYCNIPGHRAAGMEAAVNVGPAAPPPEGAPPAS
jgi:plastocyanin